MFDGKREHLLFFFNIALVCLLCFAQYYRHQETLFFYMDGQWLYVLSKAAFSWTDAVFSKTWIPFELLGTTYFVNESLFPLMHFARMFADVNMSQIAFFSMLTVELFAAIYFLCRQFECSRADAAFVAWVAISLELPLFERSAPLGKFFLVAPFHAHYVALICLALICFRLVGRARGRLRNLAAGLGFGCSILLQLITSVASAPLSLPLTAVGAFAILLLSRDKAELLWKLLAAGACLAVALAGPFAYVLGDIFYSARSMFGSEIVGGRVQLRAVSAAFGNRLNAQVYVAMAVLGALFMVRSAGKTTRTFGFAFLFYFALQCVWGWLFITGGYDQRKLPAPSYLEALAGPLLAVPISYCIKAIIEYALGLTRKRCKSDAQCPAYAKLSSVLECKYVAIVALVLCFALLNSYMAFVRHDHRQKEQIERSAITDFLRTEIALSPGQSFRGRSLSLIPNGSYTDEELSSAGWHAEKASWGFTMANPGMSNIHTLHHLWEYNIPTLEGYEQTLSAPYYALYSRLASAAPWMINLSCISRFNLPLFAASGVRYVVTSKPVRVEGMAPRALVVLLGGRLVDQGAVDGYDAFARRAAAGDKGYYLYEIAAPNVGQYSPAEVRLAPTVADALDVLGAPGFDYAREVVLHEPLPAGEALRPGVLESMRVVRGGLEIQAHSDGRSLLLLPFEFSRAWTWIPEGREDGVLLRRADIAMTALVFTGRIKGTLRYACGPWTNPWARLEDLRDIKRMGIKDIPLRPLSGAARYL